MAFQEISREKLGFALFTRMSLGRVHLAVVLPALAMDRL